MNEPQKSYYAIIPANVRYDKTLPPNAKLLYGEITALCNEKGYCWASNDYFSKLYEVTKASVSSWISKLVKGKYITVEMEYKKGSKEILHRYIRLFEYPIQEKLNTPIQEKLIDNNTNINNTINNTINKRSASKTKKSTEKLNYSNIETEYENSFKELFPNGKLIQDYARNRKRIKTLLQKLSEDEIISVIQKAKSDDWIKSTGFALSTILSDFQINKLLNGNANYSKPAYGQSAVQKSGADTYVFNQEEFDRLQE